MYLHPISQHDCSTGGIQPEPISPVDSTDAVHDLDAGGSLLDDAANEPGGVVETGTTRQLVDTIDESVLEVKYHDQPWRRQYKTTWGCGVTTWEMRDAFFFETGEQTKAFVDFEEKRTGMRGTTECHWDYTAHSTREAVVQTDGYKTVVAQNKDTTESLARRWDVDSDDFLTQNLFR
jgi:hypothetical protein